MQDVDLSLISRERLIGLTMYFGDIVDRRVAEQMVDSGNYGLLRAAIRTDAAMCMRCVMYGYRTATVH